MFGPVYCDSDEGFLSLFRTLVSCFEEQLKEKNMVTLLVPSTKTPNVQNLVKGAAEFERVSYEFIFSGKINLSDDRQQMHKNLDYSIYPKVTFLISCLFSLW